MTVTDHEWAAVVANLLGDQDEDVVHLVCCRPELALCGVNMSGPYAEDDDEADECSVCVHVDRTEKTCGARFCKLRQRWRNRRSQ